TRYGDGPGLISKLQRARVVDGDGAGRAAAQRQEGGRVRHQGVRDDELAGPGCGWHARGRICRDGRLRQRHQVAAEIDRSDFHDVAGYARRAEGAACALPEPSAVAADPTQSSTDAIVDDLSIRHAREGREFVRSKFAVGHDVIDAPSANYQMVRDYSPVALPPQSFRAQVRGAQSRGGCG